MEDQVDYFALGVAEELDLCFDNDGEEYGFRLGIDGVFVLAGCLGHELAVFVGDNQVEVGCERVGSGVFSQDFGIDEDHLPDNGLVVGPSVLQGDGAHDLVAQRAAGVRIGHDHRAFAAH